LADITSRSLAATGIQAAAAARVAHILARHLQAPIKQLQADRRHHKATHLKVDSTIRLVARAQATGSNHSTSSKDTANQLAATVRLNTNSKATAPTLDPHRTIKRRTANRHPVAPLAAMAVSTTHLNSITAKRLTVATAQTLHTLVQPLNMINTVNLVGTKPTRQLKETTHLHRRWALIQVREDMVAVQEATISQHNTVVNLKGAMEVVREATGSRVADMVARRLRTPHGNRGRVSGFA